MTFDALHALLLEQLLRTGRIKWPGGHTSLDVRDSYRGLDGYRWLKSPRNWRRYATLSDDMKVISAGLKVSKPKGGIGNRDKHDAILNAGIASHEDVRNVLSAALKREEVYQYVAEWWSTNFRAIVIDEVYDAAKLDLDVARIAEQAGLSVTVIGDPRQALYGWRGARPDLVEKFLTETTEPFTRFQLTRSFRFVGRQMPSLASTLRQGHPASIPAVESTEVDVALARQWKHLWYAGENVLPLAFRNINNATDAMLNLLLDLATCAHFSQNSYGREISITQLRLSREPLPSLQRTALQPLLEALADGTSPSEVLDALRKAARTLGAGRRPTRLEPKAEASRVRELGWLAKRLQRTDLIPGLTVHQAKGKEWRRVGVVLTDKEQKLLASGLRELDEDDCVIYVALTRAKEQCGLLAADLDLRFETDDMP